MKITLTRSTFIAGTPYEKGEFPVVDEKTGKELMRMKKARLFDPKKDKPEKKPEKKEGE